MTDESSGDSDIDDPLFHGACTSRTSFSQRFLEIKKECTLSDKAVSVILDFITDILPVPNRCPSWYQVNAQVDVNIVKSYFTSVKDENGTYYTLDLLFQMENLINATKISLRDLTLQIYRM